MKFMKDFGSSRRSSMSSWSYNPYCRRLWIQALVHIDLPHFCFFRSCFFFALDVLGNGQLVQVTVMLMYGKEISKLPFQSFIHFW